MAGAGSLLGTRLGVYEVQALVGAGGMGEVYRAGDTRLQRDVAIKILPDTFANDPERVMRFEREARLLAALNHPNIAAIYGVEDRGSPSGQSPRQIGDEPSRTTDRSQPLFQGNRRTVAGEAWQRRVEDAY